MADEIFDRILGKQAAELVIELARQGLVVGEYQGRAIQALDEMRHGECLTRACNPEKDASLLAIFQLGNEFFNCFTLAASRP